MSVSTTEGNSVGAELFGGTAHAAVATWHVALFTASPGSGGAGTKHRRHKVSIVHARFVAD